MRERSFLQRAVALARESGGGPFGAVVARGTNIIAEGWDQVTSTSDPTAHAEMIAIRKASAILKRTDLSDCEIFTNCEPCPMCLGAIYWANLHKIYYSNTMAEVAKIGFDDQLIYKEIISPPERRKIPAIRLLSAKSELVLARWATNHGKPHQSSAVDNA